MDGVVTTDAGHGITYGASNALAAKAVSIKKIQSNASLASAASDVDPELGIVEHAPDGKEGKEGGEGKDAPVVNKSDDPPVSFLRLFSTADRWDKVLILLGTIGAIGNGATWPIFAILFSDFTNTFGNSAAPDFLDNVSSLALKFVYLAIGAAVASFIETCFWTLSGNRQTNRLRKHYLAAVMRQDISFFDTQATTGGLLEGLNEDSLMIQNAISEKLGAFIHHCATFVVGFAIAFWHGWDMTLVMVGCVPFLGLAGFALVKMTGVMSDRAAAAYTEAASILQQTLSQVRTVAAYSQEEQSQKHYAAALELPVKAGITTSWIKGFCLGAVQFVMINTYAVAFIYGAYRVAAGVYTGGDVLAVVVAALLGGFALGQAAPNLEYFAKGRMAGARIFRVMDRCPVIEIDGPGRELPEVQGNIELREVDFAYPARPEVLVFRKFSLSVPAGQTMALVGSSGSGKSTVVGLMERFYDPSAGAVYLDGVDLRQLKLSWLRSQVGLVNQEPTLFATTILENILMGRPGASREEAAAAARSANAHKFIELLPEGYDTHVGERGLALSGGQKQRIAIARAILKNPKILLLDEATSALDTESERIVQEALDRMVVGRTTVVVAHRLSTIKNADVIAVVQAGQVVERGSHEALLSDPVGVYTNLVKLQMQKENEKEEGESSGSIPAVGGVANGDRYSHSFEVAGGKDVQLTQLSGSEQPIASKDDNVVAIVPDKQQEQAQAAAKPAPKPVNVPFSRLLALNKPELHLGVLGAVSSAALGAIQPAFAFIISSVITIFYNHTPDQTRSGASFYCWMFFVVATSNLLLMVVQQVSFGTMGQRLGQRVRTMLFGAVLKQEIGWFDLDENSSGKLTSALTTDASMVRGAVGDVIGLVLQNLFTLAFGCLIALIYNWRMALVVLGALPFMLSAAILYNTYVLGGNSDADKLYAGANQTVTDAFSSIRVIQAYGLQPTVSALYASMIKKANVTVNRGSVISGLSMAYSGFSLFALYGLITYFGGVNLQRGWSDFDGFLKAFLAILLSAIGLANAQMGFPDVGKAKTAVQRIFPIIDRRSKIDPSDPSGVAQGQVAGSIELRNVMFAYPARPSVIVFRNFNLLVQPGKVAALVGESGSGKSTIVGLIERFYDPLEGEVLLDGVNLRNYQVKYLRKQIALVSQEPLLFSTDILGNIRFGNPEATMEEVIEAAKAANAHEFITALPEGYNTRVGERGIQLSGGQKQRVAIARAVVKNPRILLLDEATSALDARAERVVQTALDRIMIGKTSIVVAHRLSTIRNADSIALVYRGSILEQGSHEQLMAIPGGGYARLVAAQTKRTAK